MLTLAFAVPAQMPRAFPNELPGYKFFGNGKLKGIELLVSSRSDIERIFGGNCDPCAYDADWRVSFEYFDDIWTRESSNNKGDKVSYRLDPKYLGKVRTIVLRPVRPISFANVAFPAVFTRIIINSTTDGRSGKSRMTVNDAFQDGTGLTYEIFDRTNYDDIKSPGTPVFEKGELVLIRYNLTDTVQKTLFILQE